MSAFLVTCCLCPLSGLGALSRAHPLGVQQHKLVKLDYCLLSDLNSVEGSCQRKAIYCKIYSVLMYLLIGSGIPWRWKVLHKSEISII